MEAIIGKDMQRYNTIERFILNLDGFVVVNENQDMLWSNLLKELDLEDNADMNDAATRKMFFAYRKCYDMDTVASFLSKIYAVILSGVKPTYTEYSKKKLSKIHELFKQNDDVDVVKYFYEVLKPGVE